MSSVRLSLVWMPRLDRVLLGVAVWILSLICALRQQRRVTMIDRRRIRQIKTRMKINGALPNPKSTPGFVLWNMLSLKFLRSDRGWGKASLMFCLISPKFSDIIERIKEHRHSSDSSDSRLLDISQYSRVCCSYSQWCPYSRSIQRRKQQSQDYQRYTKTLTCTF